MGRERTCHLRDGHSGEVRQRAGVLMVGGTGTGDGAHWLHRVRGVRRGTILRRWVSNRVLVDGISQCRVLGRRVRTEWRTRVIHGRFQGRLEFRVEGSWTRVRSDTAMTGESVMGHGERRGGLERELRSTCRTHRRRTDKLERWRLLQRRVMRSSRRRI